MKSVVEDDVPSIPYISILYKEHAKYLNEKLKDDDLSFGLFPLLIRIYHNDGVYQEQLAESFHLNESTITRNLKKLEEKGLIERIPDKRKKIIKITPKGEIKARKVMDYDDVWDDKIKEIIGVEEYNNFIKNLKLICGELI